MSCDGLAGSVGGSSLLVFVRSLVHVLVLYVHVFPIVSPCIPIVLVLHRTASKCLSVSLFPATERLGFCVSRPDQLKDIREQLQALSSVDVLETWGSWGQRWTMLPHIRTRRHRHGLLGLCAEVWAANFVEGHQAAARSSDLMPWRVSRSESIREHQSIWEVHGIYRRLQRRPCIVEPTRICFRHAMDPVWQDTVDGKPERKSSPCSRAACHDPCPSFAKAEECYRFAWEPGWRNAKQVFRNFNAHYLSASDLNMGILCVFQVSFLGCAVTWV